MHRYLLILFFFSLGCSSPDPERYELRSPCVSIDAQDIAADHAVGGPCIRRHPKGNILS